MQCFVLLFSFSLLPPSLSGMREEDRLTEWWTQSLCKCYMCMKREYGNSEKERGAQEGKRELCWPLRTSTRVWVWECKTHTQKLVHFLREAKRKKLKFCSPRTNKIWRYLKFGADAVACGAEGKKVFSLCRVRKIRRKSLVFDMLQQLFLYHSSNYKEKKLIIIGSGRKEKKEVT